MDFIIFSTEKFSNAPDNRSTYGRGKVKIFYFSGEDTAQMRCQRFQYEVHKPGKRDNRIRKAVNWIRETSQLNQYKKQ